jgi:hypothetical protein
VIVTSGRATAIAALVVFARFAPSLAAQAVPNRATGYLAVTDVADARALWVNPAGLATHYEASVHLDLTVRQPGGRGRLGQITAGFNTRGLSFGYQRDNLSGGIHGHTYRLGLAGGYDRLSAGMAITAYRGGTKGTAWDVGARYDWRPQVSFGGVVRNLGRPTVRGVREDVTFVPATTIRMIGNLFAVSVQATLGPAATRGYMLEVGAQLPGHAGFGLIGRIDTDASWRRRALVLGFSVGRGDRVGLVGSTPGDFSQVDAASLYGVSSRLPR